MCCGGHRLFIDVGDTGGNGDLAVVMADQTGRARPSYFDRRAGTWPEHIATPIDNKFHLEKRFPYNYANW